MIETHPVLSDLLERPSDVQHVAPSAVRRLLAELSAHRRLLDEIETALRAIDPTTAKAPEKKKPNAKRRQGLVCSYVQRTAPRGTPW